MGWIRLSVKKKEGVEASSQFLMGRVDPLLQRLGALPLCPPPENKYVVREDGTMEVRVLNPMSKDAVVKCLDEYGFEVVSEEQME